MKVLTLEAGQMGANCYIVYCEDTKQGAVIDPGGDADRIMDLINKHNLKVDMILLTHGHFDHIGAVAELKDSTGARVGIHREDGDFLTDIHKNLSFYMTKGSVQVPPDFYLNDGDVLNIGSVTLKVLHTPGHTKGGVTFFSEGALFTGDTLFKETVGRTDLMGGSHEQLIDSIEKKLLVYDDNTLVYPGHGEATNIRHEKRKNPYLI